MFKTTIHKYIEYHIQSKNTKALSNSKSDHLHHYREDIIIKQNKVGLEIFKQGEEIVLPSPRAVLANFHEVMCQRKSSRDFSETSLCMEDLSTLLHYSLGYNKERNRKYVPSSGGFCSVEVFPLILNVEGIERGLYYFDAEQHNLKMIEIGDYRKWVKNEVYYQEEWSRASVVFILVSNTRRLYEKYFARSYRLSLLDVGHVSQTLYLTATALDLKVCACGGYVDSELDSAIGIDGVDLSTFLTLIVGTK